jgi:serine/threonine-protein kinase
MRILLAVVLLAAPAHAEELPEARALYERAMASFQTRTEDGLRESLRLFDEAAALDPEYASAHAGVADASCLLALYGFAAPKEVMPRARASATDAIRLDDGLAEAHAALGLVRYLYDWDFAAAERSFEKALALDPDYATARHWYAMMLMASGRYDESLLQIERAIALDESSALYDVKRGTILMAAGNLDEAERHLRGAAARHPNPSLAERELGRLELLRGRPEEALLHLDSDEVTRGLVLGLLGREREAREILLGLEEAEGYVSPIDIALVRVGLDENEKALDALERAVEGRDSGLVYVRTEPGFESLRSEPRFRKILSEVYR